MGFSTRKSSFSRFSPKFNPLRVAIADSASKTSSILSSELSDGGSLIGISAANGGGGASLGGGGNPKPGGGGGGGMGLSFSLDTSPSSSEAGSSVISYPLVLTARATSSFNGCRSDVFDFILRMFKSGTSSHY